MTQSRFGSEVLRKVEDEDDENFKTVQCTLVLVGSGLYTYSGRSLFSGGLGEQVTSLLGRVYSSLQVVSILDLFPNIKIP